MLGNENEIPLLREVVSDLEPRNSSQWTKHSLPYTRYLTPVAQRSPEYGNTYQNVSPQELTRRAHYNDSYKIQLTRSHSPF